MSKLLNFSYTTVQMKILAMMFYVKMGEPALIIDIHIKKTKLGAYAQKIMKGNDVKLVSIFYVRNLIISYLINSFQLSFW